MSLRTALMTLAAGVAFAATAAGQTPPDAPQPKPAAGPTTPDKPPEQFRVQVLFVRVPAPFVSELGLGADSGCVLTPREGRLLAAALKHAPGQEVLARPQLLLTDNQQGFFQTAGLVTRVVPRLAPDGKTILLRAEAQLSQTHGTSTDTQSAHATVSVPVGGALVMQGGMRSTTDGGEASEVLVVMTVERVAPPAK